MIVTCPSCEAKYRVNAAALEARRGKVKCASCAHVWTVEEEALTLSEPVAAPEPEPVFEAEPAPSLSEKPHAAIRARAETRRRKQRLAAEGVGWLGAAACLVVLAGAAVVMRVDVVEAWPRTAGAYAAVGLDVNPYGFEIEALTAQVEIVEDEPVLVVAGAVRNTSGEAQPAPTLQAVAYDATGVELAVWSIAMEAAALSIDAPARFQALLPEPPEEAVRIEVIAAG